MIRKVLNSLRQIDRELALAILSGVLYFVGFCGFDQFYLSWFCLVPVLWALSNPTVSTKQALAISWVFGFTTHLGGYTWINHLLENFAYLPLAVAIPIYMLLCIAQGSLLAAWGWGIFYLQRQWKIPFILSAPPLMIVLEWIYPALFPSYLANSQYQILPVIQSAEIWGLLGISGLMVFASTVIHQWLEVALRKPSTLTSKQVLKPTAVLVVLFTLNLVYGFWAIDVQNKMLGESNERIKIGTVQTNMGIYQKRKDPIEGLKRHRQQSLQLQAQGADLIVWPESGFYRAISSKTKNLKAAVLGPIRTPLLFGGLRTHYPPEGKREIYNTAFLTNADGDVLGTYDKTFLLAFGEYLPGGDLFPFLYKLSPNTSHFNRGTHTRPLELNGIRYGVLICYEDILPRFVQKVMTHKPHVLVNITNDAWFGDTHEPTIHLALAIFRTIEHRRYLVRSTNTGISAMIDPTGKITQQTTIFERVNLLESIVPLQTETIYAQFGDWIAYLSLLSLLGMVIIERKRAQS